jgi:hypothetical protein
MAGTILYLASKAGGYVTALCQWSTEDDWQFVEVHRGAERKNS